MSVEQTVPHSFEELKKPASVFAAATKEPIVKEALYYWEHGHCSWNEAMNMAVVLLADKVQRLQKDVVIQTERQGPQPILSTWRPTPEGFLVPIPAKNNPKPQ